MNDPDRIADDGLILGEVGGWAETKYRLLSLYDTLFSTGMKHKWGTRVYIDLYAAAGYSKVRGTEKILAGSPIIALSVVDPFDKYIFCEQNPESLQALQVRARRIAPAADVTFVEGDCNERIAEIISSIPVASPGQTVLSLCFVDPYDIGIKFATLQALSTRYVDFVVLLALYMDANRNYSQYLNPKSTKIYELLGNDEWRSNWAKAQMEGESFPHFLATEFSRRMATLGYIPTEPYRMKEVRSDDKNLPLYHLALFSRHERAYQFWDQVLKYGTDQLPLF